MFSGSTAETSIGCLRDGCDSRGPTMFCAACGTISYCSRECQRLDWRQHKKACLACRPLKHQNLTPIQQRVLKLSLQAHVPPIDEEFQRRFPGRPSLEYFFLRASRDSVAKLPMTNLEQLTSESESLEDTLKRWQEASVDLREFLLRAEVGDVFQNKKYHQYENHAPQQFRNTAFVSQLPLQNGKTHIEIGFTDFGTVIDSTAALKPLLEPLTVLAYDSDPFCVAKTLVMLQMMKNTKTTPRNIVEVWINSMWSKATLDIFSAAVSKIISGHNTASSSASGVLHPRVLVILEFWHGVCSDNNKLISVREAEEMQRDAEMSRMDPAFAMTAAALASEDDRVDFLWYFFTKSLYGVAGRHRHMVCGSVVMCTSNPDIGIKQLYANCFEALPWSLWLEAKSDRRQSVVDVARTYFEGQVSMFMEHLRGGSLFFSPKLGEVSIQNRSLLREIRDSNPFTVSWSNVVDYLSPQEFHSVAKEISGPDTVHIAHSCNWTTRVFGTDVMDLAMQTRLGVYTLGLAMLVASQKATGSRFLPLAPDHCRNVASVLLSRRFINRFLRYLFEGEDVVCGTVSQTPLVPHNTFLRSPSTAHFQFAYGSTGIDFGEMNYNYLDNIEK